MQLTFMRWRCKPYLSTQAEQIKAVGETKLTSKKRNGVAHFVKYFPVYVGRVESQLVGSETLEIRQSVDGAYDRIVHAMFDSLKHMAKISGEEEDKGQLNYHVILIGKSIERCRTVVSCMQMLRSTREHALLCR